MIVKKINLQNLRTHKKAQFEFQNTTIIIGRNTAGKTNILESLYILSHGKSFRAENDRDVISEGRDFTRIEAEVESDEETKKLTVIFADKNGYLSKKFLIKETSIRGNTKVCIACLARHSILKRMQLMGIVQFTKQN